MANEPRAPQGAMPPQHRSYLGNAVLTMVLYCFLFLPGLIANVAFWQSARRYREATGVAPEGYGCLTALLVVGLAVVALAALPVVLLSAASCLGSLS